MGNTYHAQVEVFFPATIHKKIGSWQAISRWELQKDFAFAEVFMEHTYRGWPDDCDIIIGQELYDQWKGEYSGKCHCDGATIRNFNSDQWFEWAKQLKQHIIALGHAQSIRVLMWYE